MLTDAQKKAILEQDRSAKATYLSAAPAISNAAVKNHEKYKAYEANIGSHWEIATIPTGVCMPSSPTTTVVQSLFKQLLPMTSFKSLNPIILRYKLLLKHILNLSFFLKQIKIIKH